MLRTLLGLDRAFVGDAFGLDLLGFQSLLNPIVGFLDVLLVAPSGSRPDRRVRGSAGSRTPWRRRTRGRSGAPSSGWRYLRRRTGPHLAFSSSRTFLSLIGPGSSGFMPKLRAGCHQLRIPLRPGDDTRDCSRLPCCSGRLRRASCTTFWLRPTAHFLFQRLVALAWL